MERQSDQDVAAALSGGQPDALKLVYERFGPLVYSIAIRSLGVRSGAEDVTQQVFVSAWRSRDRFDRGRGTLGGWLVTITRNKVADALRDRQRHSRVLAQVTGGASVAAPEAPADRVVDRIVLTDELAQLTSGLHPAGCGGPVCQQRAATERGRSRNGVDMRMFKRVAIVATMAGLVIGPAAG